MFQANQKGNTVKLYNVFFPIWFLLLFPLTWIVVLPANFIWDSILLILACKFFKIPFEKAQYKKVILPIWFFGFLSDFIAAIPLIAMLFFPGSSWFDDYIITPVMSNPFESPFALAYVALAVVLGGVCIYFLNLKISFKKWDILLREKQKISLILAVFSAPYLFFVPTVLLYRWVR